MNGLLGIGVLYDYAVRALVVLIVIPFHEAAHALVSWLLGDPTAKNAGRLSLNPLRHFDPLGTLCMVLGGVGWAKPVSINPRRFRDPKIGMAVSAAAGPVSNFLLGFVSTIIYKAVWYASAGQAPQLVMDFLWYMIAMNISLGVFNLIPVPPFDGSRIALLFLPRSLYFRVMQYERYIMAAVLILVLLGLLNAPLGFFVNIVYRAFMNATGFVEAAFGLL
ncbi:site-2 protease family protein [uncultured Gemmiger sp.]|uniref:site-2 protease family protein n=1 Tax=uncultured Gemmiger sp. TaxID=1623490 RepID=UPI0025D3602A|nr:site-2 protease family protein [uncultured Gemmiger sp.]